MEEELKVFKDKIKMRFQNAEIPKNYIFPRGSDDIRIFSPEAVYFRRDYSKKSRNGEQTRNYSKSFYNTSDGMKPN